MKVAVADMTDDRRENAGSLNVGHGRGDAFGKPRDRHAGVGRDDLDAGAKRLRRPVGIVAGLPETGALLRLDRPLEGAAAALFGDLAEGFRLLAARTPRCRAVRRTASAARATPRCAKRFVAFIIGASSNSMRATGNPDWIAMMVALHAPSTLANGTDPPAIASGRP